MNLHDLQPPVGAKATGRKRLGRGIGSGLGKTSGKGHKGQLARSGGGKRPGFEGGQTPLARRLPKRGFTNIFKTEYSIVNLGDLARFDKGCEITPSLLVSLGMAKKNMPVKILGNGEIDKALKVSANKFSESAVAKITAAGGEAEVI